MPQPANYPHIHELYEVERTIDAEVTLQDVPCRVRIEALHDLKSGDYSTRAYIEREIIQPQSSVLEMPTLLSRDRLWVSFDLPWTSGKSADSVLDEALNFLEARCR